MEYIIVQAGGLGSRMKKYTKNKPKAIVPVNNLPIIFHLFKKYPDKKFVIIGDYKKDVLKKYLATFAKVNHIIVGTDNKKGTCSGIANALEYIPENKQFLLIWSDLVLPEDFVIPEDEDNNYIGISKDFICRLSYKEGDFYNESSSEHGVAGLFSFKNKEQIKDVPLEGEFVLWLKEQKMLFKELYLKRAKEYGLFETIEQPESGRCRPFNHIEVKEDKIIKTGIDEQGRELAKKEIAWYDRAKKYNITNIPQIYGLNPLIMQKIEGKNVFLLDLDEQQKREVLYKIVDGLKQMHTNGLTDTDYFSIKDAYYTKTMQRLEKVRNLIPGADREYIEINGKKCRNIFFNRDLLEEKIQNLRCKNFCFIHGDCTFSNIIIDNELNPYFIDPRGYFGGTLFYGDALYDWAKLYYSIVGNYDRFNLKQFVLEINDNYSVNLSINSNGWESMGDYFFEIIKDEVKKEDLELIHAIIWLSLTTYAWEDYDSICGAFYNGLYYLEDLL